MKELTQYAKNYHEQGYKLVITDSNKRPVASWAKFQESQTWSDIESMLSKSNAHSIAIIATDNIEVIDIDCKYDLTGKLFNGYLKACIASGLSRVETQKLFIQRTKNGGYHIAYKAHNSQGNQKLAQRYTTIEEQNGNPNDSTRVLLETRGDGGYFLVSPSKGYVIEETPSTGNLIEWISNESRDILINVAKTFDECDTHHRHAPSQQRVPQEIKGSNKTTIEAYNESINPLDLLINEGWTYSHQRGDNYYLVRPNKSVREGHGASYNEKMQLVYIFTSSTILEQNKAYDSFALYAALNHNSDYSSACKDLYRQGYGERLSKTRDSFAAQTTAITSGDSEQAEKVVSNDSMLQMYKSSRVRVEDSVKRPDWILSIEQENSYFGSEEIGLACYGDVVLLTGLQKSRKTGISSSICASSIGDGVDVLGFRCRNGSRKTVYIDTEQAQYQASRLIHRIHEQANVDKTTTNQFHYNRVKKYTKIEKQRFLRWLCEYVKDIGVLILDGVVDLCEDYNDNKVSSKLVTYIETLADEFNILIVVILHDARSTGNARGHLGTELLNKTSCHIKVVKASEEEGSHSTVSFPNTRDKQPNSFDFTHNEDGQLVRV